VAVAAGRWQKATVLFCCENLQLASGVIPVRLLGSCVSRGLILNGGGWFQSRIKLSRPVPDLGPTRQNLGLLSLALASGLLYR
jgi:hypothetical protein